MKVYRVTSAKALTTDDMIKFFDKAFKDGPVDGGQVLKVMVAVAADPRVQVLVGMEKSEFKTLAITYLPSSPLYPNPQVYFMYSEGTAALRNATVDALVDWVKKNGYNDLWVVNWNVGKDVAFKRLFKRAGEMAERGTGFAIKLGPEGMIDATP